MLAFLLILTIELIILFRLMLPDMLAFFERRYDEVYNVPHGDCFQSSLLTKNHAPGDTL
jgi:hypothetical protein